MSLSLKLEPILSFFPCLVERGPLEKTQQSSRLASTLQPDPEEAGEQCQVETDNADRYSLQTMPDPHRRDILFPAIKHSRRRIELNNEHEHSSLKPYDGCDTSLDQEDFSVDRTHDTYDYVAVISAKKKIGKPKAAPPQLELSPKPVCSLV